MFSIVITLFNDEKNIITLLDEISCYLENIYEYEIILINDFSTDNTLNTINQYADKKNITVINNKKNEGQSYSIFEGVKNTHYIRKD